ncbi:YihY/virulence factor BrkB family protein [Elongatibacter sediminis]|uniref:YihY/virulence factor BrkB family protein n=1 Tax=Elongatibacter sediminis TaxID=3119006 RepID=A0AAW9RCE6_9GAMM
MPFSDWLDRLKALPERLPRPVRYWLDVVVAAARNWSDSQAFIYSAALAFFTVFSIAPVMIVVVALVGLVLGQEAASGELMEQLQQALGSDAAEVVQTAVLNSRIEQSGIWPTLVGVTAIALGATTVFAQMQKSLNRIWDVVPRPSRSSAWRLIKARLLSLTVVLAIGFVLLVSLLLSVLLRTIMTFADQWLPMPGWIMVGAELMLSLVVVTGLFAAIFKILPDVVVRWRDVLSGALVTALLFTVGRSLIALYLAKTATASTYGAAGSLVLLLLWVNYSALILLFGAAITRAVVEKAGKPVRPRSIAVRVRRETVEEVDE